MNLALLRKIVAVESLPPPPREAGEARRRSRLRQLVAPEVLPLDPVRPPSGGTRWLRLLLVPEPLPADAAAPARQRHTRWLEWLFAGEPLPADAAAPARQRRTRWLRWLFAREPIERDPN